jgi:hypothetical protein
VDTSNLSQSNLVAAEYPIVKTISLLRKFETLDFLLCKYSYSTLLFQRHNVYALPSVLAGIAQQLWLNSQQGKRSASSPKHSQWLLVPPSLILNRYIGLFPQG